MAGTDDDNSTPFGKKLPADFVEKFRVPSDVARQIKSLTHPERMPPSLTPEAHRAIDLLIQKRRERAAIDQAIRTTEQWLVASGVDPRLWAEPTPQDELPQSDLERSVPPEPPLSEPTELTDKDLEILTAAKEIWPPDGMVPPDIRRHPADLMHRIETLHKDKAKRGRSRPTPRIGSLARDFS
jgi:hypothetical protein